MISSQNVSFLEEKKSQNSKHRERVFQRFLFTTVRLMTSFLTHCQRPTDYTIKPQQRHNGTKNMNMIILL